MEGNAYWERSALLAVDGDRLRMTDAGSSLEERMAFLAFHFSRGAFARECLRGERVADCTSQRGECREKGKRAGEEIIRRADLRAESRRIRSCAICATGAMVKHGG